MRGTPRLQVDRPEEDSICALSVEGRVPPHPLAFGLGRILEFIALPARLSLHWTSETL